MIPNQAALRIGVDIGGTFVDAVALDVETHEIHYHKVPATPAQPADGVMSAVSALGLPLADVDRVVHGTTLGLNTILERTGATTGIITNAGFRDVFLIGRGSVPDARQYDFRYRPAAALVRREHTVGVAGRIDARGRVVEELDEDGVRAAARGLVEQGVRAMAICFLHSFRDPSHERRAAQIVREACPGVAVSVATDIAREHREYERTATAVLDAYVRPVFESYLGRLEHDLRSKAFRGRLLVLRSGGGAMTADQAKGSPIHSVLSGPAGGAAGASHVAALLGRDELISFDMGGTSLDVCVFERGSPSRAREAELVGYPLLIPALDIRSIGAGGGSLARVESGRLRVGPESAGATPGPICYARGGTRPTVTDAALCLGYIDPVRFLAGAMPLDAPAARRGLEEQLALPLSTTIEAAAAGVFDVLVAKTIGAVRQVTVERGRDARGFTLLAFGGAGPLVAPLVAREMGIAEVIVPTAPAAFSAWGMLGIDIVDDFSRTDLRILADVPVADFEAIFGELEREALRSLASQGVAPADSVILRQLELRYLGQAHALAVDVRSPIEPEGARRAFERLHLATYGHGLDAAVQILHARVRGAAKTASLPLPPPVRASGSPARALIDGRHAFSFVHRDMREFPVYDRAFLSPGDRIKGPLLVDEGTSTTIVQEDQVLDVNPFGHLLVHPAGSTSR